MTTRYKLNVLGSFFVEDGCCTLCGVPKMAAPELFDENIEHCWVKKQPSSFEELEHMVDAMRIQELSCIHYAGRNPEVISYLHSVGEGAQCIEASDRESPTTVTFVARDLSGAELLEELGKYIKARDRWARATPPVADAPRLTIRIGRLFGPEHTIDLEPQPEGRWLLEHDGNLALTGVIQGWLATFAAEIRWQTERGEQPEPW